MIKTFSRFKLCFTNNMAPNFYQYYCWCKLHCKEQLSRKYRMILQQYGHRKYCVIGESRIKYNQLNLIFQQTTKLQNSRLIYKDMALSTGRRF